MIKVKPKAVLWLIFDNLIWILGLTYIINTIVDWLHYFNIPLFQSHLDQCMKQPKPWVVLTGVTSGIGKDLFERIVNDFQDANYLVIGRDETLLLKLKKIFSDVNIEYLICDLVKQNVEVVVEPWLNSHPHALIAMVVNCAGITASKSLPLVDQDHSEISTVIHANLRNPIILTKLIVEQMMKKRCKGLIVNISSSIVNYSLAKTTAYSSSKSALSCFSESLDRELNHLQIKVLCFEPALVETKLIKNVDRNFTMVQIHKNGYFTYSILKCISLRCSKTRWTPHPLHNAINFCTKFIPRYIRAMYLKNMKLLRA